MGWDGVGFCSPPAALPRKAHGASPLPLAFLFLNLFGSFIKATKQFSGLGFFIFIIILFCSLLPVWLCLEYLMWNLW